MNKPHKHSANKGNIYHKDHVQKYLNDELSHAQRHELEETVLNSKLLSEAMEGLESIGADEVHTDLEILQERIDQRTSKSQKEVNLSPIWLKYAAVIAMILVSASAIYFITQISPSGNDNTLSTVEEFEEEAKHLLPTDVEEVADEPTTIQADEGLKPNVITATPKSHEIKSLETSDNEAKSRAANKEGGSKVEKTPVPTDLQEVINETISEEITDIGFSNELNLSETENIKPNDDAAKSEEVEFFADKRGSEEAVISINERADAVNRSTQPESTNKTLLENEDQVAAIKSEKVSPEAKIDTPSYILPSVKGGDTAFKTYVKKNLIFPEEAKTNGITGEVTVSFLVLPNGNLSDFSIVKGIGYGCDKEAIRLIKNGPQWHPAEQNGEKIEKITTCIITFEH